MVTASVDNKNNNECYSLYGKRDFFYSQWSQWFSIVILCRSKFKSISMHLLSWQIFGYCWWYCIHSTWHCSNSPAPFASFASWAKWSRKKSMLIWILSRTKTQMFIVYVSICPLYFCSFRCAEAERHQHRISHKIKIDFASI